MMLGSCSGHLLNVYVSIYLYTKQVVRLHTHLR